MADDEKLTYKQIEEAVKVCGAKQTGGSGCFGCPLQGERRCVNRLFDALAEENKRLREENRWISTSERLPEDGLLVLVIVSGRVGNIHLDRAIELAEFSMDEGWILEMWPEWENPTVTHWKPMPKGPEVGHDNQ